MAEQPFSITDIERILKALFPTVGDNPLGQIKEQVIQVREEQLAFEVGWDAVNIEIFEKLDNIESRTFGILILQIIKIIRTLFGLLPAGRVILIVIALMGLLATFMESGSVSGQDIREAVERSGLGAFVREQLRRLTVLANEQAQRVDDVIELGSSIVDAAQLKASNVLLEMNFSLRELNLGTNDDATLIEILRFSITQAQEQALELSNLTDNMGNLIFGALESVPDRIRDIPALASELME